MKKETRTAPDPQIVYVDKRRISCNGGGALGHPLVWYALDEGFADCGYCDTRYVYDPAKAKGGSTL